MGNGEFLLMLLVSGLARPLSTLTHELGHYLAARACGARPGRLSVGRAGGSLELELTSVSPRRLIVIAAAGPAAETALAGALGATCVFVVGPRPLSLVLGLVAAVMLIEAAANLIPRVTEDHVASDGELIRLAVAEVRGTPAELRPAAPIPVVSGAVWWPVGIAFVVIVGALMLFASS